MFTLGWNDYLVGLLLDTQCGNYKKITHNCVKMFSNSYLLFQFFVNLILDSNFKVSKRKKKTISRKIWVAESFFLESLLFSRSFKVNIFIFHIVWNFTLTTFWQKNPSNPIFTNNRPSYSYFRLISRNILWARMNICFSHYFSRLSLWIYC